MIRPYVTRWDDAYHALEIYPGVERVTTVKSI